MVCVSCALHAAFRVERGMVCSCALHAAVTIREYIIRPVRLVNKLDDPYGLYDL